MESNETDIFKKTIEFWNKKYGIELSQDDAREAVHNVAGFFKVLQEWKNKAS